ncbi:hypothetical protein [Sutcliffiella horikoshii]|uniref:hypothetical protein n=1 Tax=Sutcliffiella horikoshii TaxID=79883 RepID=UPI00384CF2F5
MGKLSNNVSREIIHHGSINIWLTTAVPFRKWLRFPRGDLDPPRIRICSNPQLVNNENKLLVLFQLIQFDDFYNHSVNEVILLIEV